MHFIYRWDTNLITGVIIISLMAGYIGAEKLGYHEKIASFPVAKQIYQQQGRLAVASRGTVIFGVIVETNKNIVIIKDLNNHAFTIVMDKNTHFPQGGKFHYGELIKVNGLQNNSLIKAISISKTGKILRGIPTIHP